MKTKSIKKLKWIGILFAAVCVVGIMPFRAIADQDDPPGRAARLNYVRGSVSFEPAGESDWVPAVVNRPITTGDSLWTDDGARAEMHLGSATIRLDSGTGMSFLNLDDSGTQIQLSEGTLNIRVLRLDPDEYFEVDTPNQAFSILQAGQYRIEATPDGYSTLVTVRNGAGEVTGGGRTYSIAPGLTGNFTGTDTLRADIYRAADFDEFDGWSQDRDRREDSSRSARYVSRDVVGYEDLDDNGIWRSDPDYGNVWVPRVDRDWAPYRDGHWAWISPWGWTWVDDEPWGYAPFHYGRWVYARSNWCWVPGPIAVRPVYAPALVVFVGGPNFGLSLSFGGGRGGGNVGWFPLGPREVYVPGYNASREYVTRVNVTNTTVNNTTVINVYNNQVANNNRGNDTNNSRLRYANKGAPGGVTVVSQSTFTTARPVGKAIVHVDRRDIDSAPVNRRAEVAPTRNSVFGNPAPMGNRVPQPSAEIVNRTVVAKRPPPPPPVSFERQQQKLAAQPGQPLPRNEVESMRPSNLPAAQPHVRQAPPGRPATADSNQPPRQPGNAQPPAPASIGGNPQPKNGPGVRNDRPNSGNRGGQGNVPPPNPAPANPGGNSQPNNPAAIGNDRSNGANTGQPSGAQPPNSPPPNVGGNPQPNNGPGVRNDRPNSGNRGGQGNVPPPNPAPANPGGNSQPNNPAAIGNDRSNGANTGQPSGAQPPKSPPPNVGGNPQPNNGPGVRNDRPNSGNRGGQGNVPPPNPAAANPGGNSQPNNPAAIRNDRSNGANAGQPVGAQPPNPPPAKSIGNPPPNNPPAVRADRPGNSNTGQPGTVPQPSPAPANAGGNPPPNNGPARNDRSNAGSRGGPGNVPPPNPPAANVNPNPATNTGPANRNDRPNEGNRGGQGNPPPPPAKVTGNPAQKNPAPPPADDKKGRDKEKDKDNQSQQH